MTRAIRLAACGVLLSLGGCLTTTPAVTPPMSEYAELGAKQVPEFLKNTVYQHTDLANANPAPVNGYGFVVHLDKETGDTRAPNPVREYIRKEMQKHGIGSALNGVRTPSPDQMLNDRDRTTAIVRLDGFIPPGAHAGQRFDVQVSALENSNTVSLHHGTLYQADLAPRGADPFNPGGGLINSMAHVEGDQIVINPAYATDDDDSATRNQKLSMRYGRVMNRGVVTEERPLILKLRTPERRLARTIEGRLNERFQDAANERFSGSKTAVAKDEGEVWLYVPKKFGTDWERFAQVAMHSYFNGNADFSTLKAKQLAEIAEKDGAKAPLLDITYAWEACGTPALPSISSLYASPVPEVAFAAARAGAYLGDYGAEQTLGRIARTSGHPFQVTSVDILGSLPPTAQLRTTLRELLDSDQLLVRIAAYNAMVASQDPLIVSMPMHNGFTLDLLETDGAPVVYATRVGEPRIALIGRRSRIASESLLMAMKNELTILSDTQRGGVQIFYRRGNSARGAVLAGQPDTGIKVACMPDLGVVIARLGGETPDPVDRLPFQYADVVGILQRMADKKMITSADAPSSRLAAVFQIQALPGTDDAVMSAPTIPEQRPQDVPTTQPLTDAATLK